MTIIHFLKKGKRLPRPAANAVAIELDNLPTPHNQVIKELAQFAFLALQRDQLVFTSEEIKAACPKVTPTNWYGYGLLKPVRYSKYGHEVYSFHFLHFSVQEYLAAYHIASLSYYTLLKLLKDTFWNIRYINTWMMYVGISGGNHYAFKHFLAGNSFLLLKLIKNPFICPEILSNKIRCLHLLRCLGETKHHMLATVKSIFQDGTIDLSHQSLSPTDLQILVALLMRSPNEQWTKLDLSHCDLDINSVRSICDTYSLHCTMLHIKSVDISGNLNFHCESLRSLCEVLKSWCTEELILSVDNLLDQRTAKIVASFKNKLVRRLDRYEFSYLRKFAALQILYVSEQNKAIAVLVRRYHNGDVSIKCGEFPHCQLDDALLNSLKAFINTRVDHVECSCITMSEYLNIFEAITIIESSYSSKGISKIIGSLNSLSPSVQLKLQLKLHQRKMQWEVMVADFLAVVLCQNLQTPLTFLLKYTSNDTTTISNVSPHYSSSPLEKYVFRMAEYLHFVEQIVFIDVSIKSETSGDIATVLSHTNNLQHLILHQSNLQTEGVMKIAKALKGTSSLVTLNIEGNNIGDEAADDIATVLSHNIKLQTLSLYQNNLQTEGVIKIAKALQNMSSLVTLNIGGNNIGDEAADDIAIVLSRNNKLQNLGLHQNNFRAEGVIKIAKALQNTSSLVALSIEGNNIGDEAADDIAAVLFHNNKLKTLALYQNNLQTEGMIKITDALQSTSSLVTLDIGGNNIGDEAANDIAAVLFHNKKLKTLGLHQNNFQAKGMRKIAKSLQSTSLVTLNIRNNNIGKATGDLANVLSHNNKLQTLALYRSNLQTEGMIKIAKALQRISSLVTLNIGGNNIGDEAAGDISTVVFRNNKLQTLGLHHNKFCSEGMIKITNALQSTSSLVTLDIGGNNIGDEAADNIATVVFHNNKMQTLGLYQNNFQTEGVKKIAKALQSTSSLLVLDMGDNYIGDEAVDEVATVLSFNPKLQILDLKSTGLQNDSSTKLVEFLKQNSSLLVLNMGGNNCNTETVDAITVVLSHNANLLALDLSSTSLLASYAMKIATVLGCTSSLLGCVMMDGDHENLAASITAVSLITDSIQQLTNASGLYLNFWLRRNWLSSLTSKSSFLSLLLTKQHNSDSGISHKSPLIMRSVDVQVIDLSNNGLQAKNAIEMAKVLQSPPSLTFLYIMGNPIDDKLANSMAHVLAINSNLQELILCGNSLKASGTITITSALQNISSLIVLNLRDNSISDEAADSIAAVLSHNAKLKQLDLSGNNLHSEGAVKIARVLNTTCLTTFSIANNNIDDEAAEAIATVISCNNKLQYFNSKGNNMQSNGTAVVLAALQSLSCLKEFKID